MKVCDDTKNLCMQFESIVTNSSLSFKDIAFLEINREVAALLNLSELGGIRWEQLMDNLARVPENFTKEHLAGDLDKLYEMGVGLATSGVENLGDALLQTSAFHDLIGGKNQRDRQSVRSLRRPVRTGGKRRGRSAAGYGGRCGQRGQTVQLRQL